MSGVWIEPPRPLREADRAVRERMLRDPDYADLWWEREWRRSQDWMYFARNFGYAMGENGIENLDPCGEWEFQDRILLPAYGSRDDLYGIKARQGGWTTWGAIYFAWKGGVCETTKLSRLLNISMGQREADEFIARCRVAAAALPAAFKRRGAAIGKVKKETAGEDLFNNKLAVSTFNFPLRGAAIQALPSSAAGRSFTADDVLIDEAAFQDLAPVISALRPTIQIRKGRVMMVSTGQGLNEYGELVLKAMRGEIAGSRYLFSGVDDHPIYNDPAWQAKERPHWSSERAFRVEYPRTVEEALAGVSAGQGYDLVHITSAVKLGKIIKAERERFASTGRPWKKPRNGTEGGLDWGLHIGGVFGQKYPGAFGVITGDFKEAGLSSHTASNRYVAAANAQNPGLPLTTVYYDLGGAGQVSQLEFKRLFAGAIKSKEVGFGIEKGQQANAPSPKELNAAYIRTGLERAHWCVQAMESGAFQPGDLNGCLAIYPEAEDLIREMQKMALKPDGKLKKGTEDEPDHVHDALICWVNDLRREWNTAFKDRNSPIRPVLRVR
jgi:hypothetical protein